MRIIAGRSKGRTIESVRGANTRPTSDRVKESIFNIIRNRLDGSVVLDLFSGTGNLGLEALSRGSCRAVFVEADKNAVRTIKRNCDNLGYREHSEILHKDVLRALSELSRRGDVFDLIFMDPPYEKGYEVPVITAIAENGILDNQGIIIVEHGALNIQPEKVKDLYKFDERKYGNTGVSFYRKG